MSSNKANHEIFTITLLMVVLAYRFFSIKELYSYYIIGVLR